MNARLLLPLVLLAVLCGCARQPSSAPPASDRTTTERSVQAMITGLDQYESENVLVLNTANGAYVIGPEVPGAIKSDIHEHLVEMRDRVVTIRYVNMPSTGDAVAHRRVTGLITQEREFVLRLRPASLF